MDNGESLLGFPCDQYPISTLSCSVILTHLPRVDRHKKLYKVFPQVQSILSACNVTISLGLHLSNSAEESIQRSIDRRLPCKLHSNDPADESVSFYQPLIQLSAINSWCDRSCTLHNYLSTSSHMWWRHLILFQPHDQAATTAIMSHNKFLLEITAIAILTDRKFINRRICLAEFYGACVCWSSQGDLIDCPVHRLQSTRSIESI